MRSDRFYKAHDILSLPKLPEGVRTSDVRKYELQDPEEIPQAWKGNVSIVPVYWDDGNGEKLYQVRGYHIGDFSPEQ